MSEYHIWSQIPLNRNRLYKKKSSRVGAVCHDIRPLTNKPTLVKVSQAAPPGMRATSIAVRAHLALSHPNFIILNSLPKETILGGTHLAGTG